MKRLACLALTLAVQLAVPGPPLAAQPLDGDARVTTVAFREGEIVALRSAAGNGLTIIFAPGERVLGFEVADPAALDVSLSGSTDSLFVKALRAPADPQLTVRTQLRNYTFALQLVAPESAAYVVRFSYGPELPVRAEAPPPAAAVSRYKLSGTKELRPSRIWDDGVHTYLEWTEEQLLPAVFALNSVGGEEMVDGYMRGGLFTIDRVNRVLVFRIDKKSAKAERTGT